MTMLMAASGGTKVALTVDYPPSVYSVGSGLPISGSTNAVQVGAPTYTNGSGTYTYSWVKIAGSTSVVITTSSTVERPFFRGINIGDSQAENATFEVTVTDTVLGLVDTDLVNVTCEWFSTL
jgi:hypothetical protein